MAEQSKGTESRSCQKAETPRTQEKEEMTDQGLLGEEKKILDKRSSHQTTPQAEKCRRTRSWQSQLWLRCGSPMNTAEAFQARDTLVKCICSNLSAWIVFRINKSLKINLKVYKFIRVLDIYDLETFEINSFEQFFHQLCQ